MTLQQFRNACAIANVFIDDKKAKAIVNAEDVMSMSFINDLEDQVKTLNAYGALKGFEDYRRRMLAGLVKDFQEFLTANKITWKAIR